MKRKAYIFLCIIILCKLVISYMIVFVSPFKDFFVFQKQITHELHIKQHPFRNKYYLTDNTGRILLDGIITWMITKDYVYGYCCNRRCEWYIFNRKNGDRFFYDAFDDFWTETKNLQLPPPLMDADNSPTDFVWGLNPDRFPLGSQE